jgi:hypothetical protein
VKDSSKSGALPMTWVRRAGKKRRLQRTSVLKSHPWTRVSLTYTSHVFQVISLLLPPFSLFFLHFQGDVYHRVCAVLRVLFTIMCPHLHAAKHPRLFPPLRLHAASHLPFHSMCPSTTFTFISLIFLPSCSSGILLFQGFLFFFLAVSQKDRLQSISFLSSRLLSLVLPFVWLSASS